MNLGHIQLTSAQIPYIAVGICRTQHGNTHTGVAYRHSDGVVHFFHQAWHHNTRDGLITNESADMGGPFFCIVPAVDADRARAIAGFWEFIAGLHEQIGYALRDDRDALFDEVTGELTMPNGIGLSCSTFVLVLFRSVRLPYIDTTGWPVNRPSDPEAQERILYVLERTCPDRAHVDAVRQQVQEGCARVRPEEVAGASLSTALPVQYPGAEDAGLVLVGALAIRGHWQNGMN